MFVWHEYENAAAASEALADAVAVALQNALNNKGSAGSFRRPLADSLLPSLVTKRFGLAKSQHHFG